MVLDGIFAEVEVILNENQEKREAIREASKELESAIIKVVQIVRRIHQGDEQGIEPWCIDSLRSQTLTYRRVVVRLGTTPFFPSVFL